MAKERKMKFWVVFNEDGDGAKLMREINNVLSKIVGVMAWGAKCQICFRHNAHFILKGKILICKFCVKDFDASQVEPIKKERLEIHHKFPNGILVKNK